MTSQLPHLLRATRHDPGAARALHRRHRAGTLVLVAQGVYVDAEAWTALSPPGRHLVLARALTPSIRGGAAFSHVTAAIAYGWPVIRITTPRVHVTDQQTQRTEHRAHLVRHAGRPELGRPEWSFAGVPLTSRLQTALDLATTLEPAPATVAIDHAVRNGTLTIEEFTAALPERPRRGSVRSRLVAQALSPLHESAGESYTAIRMLELGVPPSVPQHPFRQADGTVDRVDFWLPDLGVVVEFDGRQKYTDRTMLGGRTPSDAVWQEKIREDRIRSLPPVRTVVRPTWWHLTDLERFRALFRQHRVVI
jgi:hypothetical protein